MLSGTLDPPPTLLASLQTGTLLDPRWDEVSPLDPVSLPGMSFGVLRSVDPTPLFLGGYRVSDKGWVKPCRDRLGQIYTLVLVYSLTGNKQDPHSPS